MQNENNNYRFFGFKIQHLSSVVLKLSRRDTEQRLNRENINISLPALAVLRLVRNDVCTTINDLSRKMMIAPPTLVPMIDGLEKKKLLTRGTDAKDRRRICS